MRRCPGCPHALGLGFEVEAAAAAEQRKEMHQSGSGGRRRRKRSGDGSGDSFTYYSSDHQSTNGNGAGIVAGSSLFSSATGSAAADRCSFGSDLDEGFSELPLAGLEHAGGGPPADPDPDSRSSPSPGLPAPARCHSLPPPNPSKVPPEDLVQRRHGEEEPKQGEEEEEGDVQVEEHSFHPSKSKHSFSHALLECESWRGKPKAVVLPGRKPWTGRPISLDFNGQSADVSLLSPRFLISGAAAMKKSSAASSRSRSGTFPSPGTPNYRHGTGTGPYPKGWSSERVPLPAHSNRRYGGSGGALMPFANGRTLPSKWEDAERWIISPVSGDGVGRSSMLPLHHRRPKSKSGPLGPPAGLTGGTYSAASPLVHCFDSGRVGAFAANSPFLAGVLIPDGGFVGKACGGKGRDGVSNVGGIGVVGGGAVGGRAYSINGEPCIVRSASIHGLSDALVESSSSFPSSHDEKFDGTRETASTLDTSILRKDVATQMSPQGNSPSCSEGPFSPSRASESALDGVEDHFTKPAVRDVEVDDRVTVTRWSKKHIMRGSGGQSANIIECKKKTVEANTCAWGVAETAKSISKHKREEAKITAWENLQKARAEAEIRKLEMKLEKKRSSSMEKILSKLRLAQKKAQDMRNAVASSQANQVAMSRKKVLYSRKNGQISSLSGCFTCHAF